MFKIKNLDELLGLDKHKTITNTNITQLSSLGESYGSVMLKVDIDVKDTVTGKKEEIHAVAKTIPVIEKLREIFNIQVTFKNEIAFYNVIVPTLQQFQRQQGINDVIHSFAQPYGARISLEKGGNTVDEDAALLLENLVHKGFVCTDRLVGFDLDGAKVIIKDLAEFSALPLAIKQKNPELFENNIKKYCKNFNANTGLHKMLADKFREILRENEKCAPFADKISCWGDKEMEPPTEVFGTICHDDLWTTNTMQKYEDGKIVENKFVDFQVYSYRSVVTDLFNFLWTSVQVPVLKDHFDDLVKYFYENFIANLQTYKCDIAPYSFEAFLKELDKEAKQEIGHSIVFSTFVVYAEREVFQGEQDFNPTRMINMVSQKSKERTWFIAQECNRRGWI